MKFESRFDIGGKVFVPINGISTQVTIGKVTIEHTDSKGRPGEDLFDNYKPQKKYKETYMCDETGVGSGSCWELGRSIFATEAECEQAIMAQWEEKNNA